MRVYVVLDNNWQCCEGGGAEVVSIHGSKDGALAKVTALFEERGNKMRTEPLEPDVWYYYRDNGVSEYWYSIEEHEVVGAETP